MARTFVTRRQFLAASAALPFALRGLAQGQTAPRWVLLGTDRGKGIYRARWNAATGELGRVQLAVAADRPDYFAKHPTLPVVYTVNSLNAPRAAVSGYRVDAANAQLTLIDRRDTHGDGPCYVSVDATGESAYAANYFGGSLTAFQLGLAGSLTQTIGVFRYSQQTHGPVAGRQDAAHLHCAVVAPGNRFLLACDLGDDVILNFPIAPGAASRIGQPARIAARPGSGPRHVAFHPNGRWVYCIHELDSTIDLYDWRVRGGEAGMTLRPDSAISTLAKGSALAGNAACEVVVSDDGRFVYCCTRGEDSIAVFHVDPASGLLTEKQRLSCGGKTPRYIAFDPSRRWLVCTNQGTSAPGPGNVTVFAYNPSTGHIHETPKTFAADTPMFVLWV